MTNDFLNKILANLFLFPIVAFITILTIKLIRGVFFKLTGKHINGYLGFPMLRVIGKLFDQFLKKAKL